MPYAHAGPIFARLAVAGGEALWPICCALHASHIRISMGARTNLSCGGSRATPEDFCRNTAGAEGRLVLYPAGPSGALKCILGRPRARRAHHPVDRGPPALQSQCPRTRSANLREQRFCQSVQAREGASQHTFGVIVLRSARGGDVRPVNREYSHSALRLPMPTRAATIYGASSLCSRPHGASARHLRLLSPDGCSLSHA